MARIFPELDNLYGVPQPAQHHPEIDTGVHSLMVLEQAALLSDKTTVRFAALMHDLGKALTPVDKWPSHHGHETLGLKALKTLCLRLRVPNNHQKLALQVMEFHTNCHRSLELKPSTLCAKLCKLGAFKAGNQLKDFLLACEADAKGRTGFEDTEYPQAEYILAAQKAAKAIDSSAITNKNLTGKAIGDALVQLRSQEISKVKQHFTQDL